MAEDWAESSLKSHPDIHRRSETVSRTTGIRATLVPVHFLYTPILATHEEPQFPAGACEMLRRDRQLMPPHHHTASSLPFQVHRRNGVVWSTTFHYRREPGVHEYWALHRDWLMKRWKENTSGYHYFITSIH